MQRNFDLLPNGKRLENEKRRGNKSVIILGQQDSVEEVA
jgi:hypothetical protein